MKDKEVYQSIDSIRGLVSEAEDIGYDTDYGWRDFHLKRAEIEAIFLLTRVIQERGS